MKIKLLLFVIMLLAVVSSIRAQEVIMNQPSGDIVDKGKLFVRSDSFYTQSPAFYQENLNLAYGLGHIMSLDGGLEVSLNNTNAFNRVPFSDALVLGLKYAPIKFNNGEWYIGDQFIIPLTNKVPGYSRGNITYVANAQRFGRDGQWRVTGGAFYSHNGVQVGNRAGALAGIEWTAHKFKNGWAIAPGVDWASGAGTNGYTSPGLNIMKGNFFICPGYMIGNPHNPNGAHQSFVMIGYTF